ncbi:MAG: extracellular solute-binding protein [Ketobacteraceae bacterium]|nr:extracellular solute-binding protein [Ketobacteraceae bacterium]
MTRVSAISLHGSPKYAGETFSPYYHANPDAPKGGTVVLPGFGSFDTLNPYLLKGISPVNSPGMGQYGIAELNEPLMVGTGFILPSPDEPQSAYCLLCDYIEFPEDYRWVRFKLKDYARFHNGDPITADDVMTSYKLLTSEKAHPSYRDIYQPVAKVEKEGPLTVTFHLSEPGLKAMIFRLGELPVMSHNFWEKHTFGESGNIAQPLSGPYKVGHAEMGNIIEFHRVPDFWAKDFPLYQGMYNFDKVRFEFFRDRTVAFEAFKSGRVDVFYEYVAKNWATAYDFPDINSGKIIKEEINHQIPSGSQAFFINTRRDKFSDIRVRKALSLLFDFEWTNTNIFAGAYKRSNTYFPNSELGARGLPSQGELKLLEPHRDSLPDALFTEPFELPQTRGNGNIRQQQRQALQLLREAGWEIRDAKLVNSKTGEPFTFEILIDQNSFARVLTPYINNLKKAGIDAQIRHIDTAQYKVRLDNLDFDMISYVLPQGLSPSHEQRLYFHSSLADTEGTKNFSGVKNKVVDAMIEKIINAETREELVSATRAMDRVLLWNYYTIPHWHLNYHRIAYRNKLQRPDKVSKLDLGFPTWWVKPKKQ